MSTVEDIELSYIKLVDEINNIEIQTINGKLISTDPTNALLGYDDFKYQVKMYLILCHAAMEEFVESLSLDVSKAAKNALKKDGIVMYKILLSLSSFYGYKVDLEEDNTTFRNNIYRIRMALDETHKRMSNDVRESHGIGLKYLRKLFYPVAIDIDSNIDLLNSLQRLQELRGEAAHSYSIVTRRLTPEEAHAIVYDCMKIMKSAVDSATLTIEMYYNSFNYQITFTGNDFY